MDKKKFEQYKKMMRFFTTMFVVAITTVVFILLWKENYNEGIVLPFYYKGYWLVGAFYIFFFIMFIYIYGGMSYGYLKKSNIIFSQELSLICANVLIYLETVLLSAKFVIILTMI